MRQRHSLSAQLSLHRRLHVRRCSEHYNEPAIDHHDLDNSGCHYELSDGNNRHNYLVHEATDDLDHAADDDIHEYDIVDPTQHNNDCTHNYDNHIPARCLDTHRSL